MVQAGATAGWNPQGLVRPQRRDRPLGAGVKGAHTDCRTRSRRGVRPARPQRL